MHTKNLAAALTAVAPSSVAAGRPLVNIYWGAGEHSRPLADVCAADDRPDMITVTGPCVSPIFGFLDTSEGCSEMRVDLARCKSGGVKVLARVDGRERTFKDGKGAEGFAEDLWTAYGGAAGTPAVDGFDIVIADDFDDQDAWSSFVKKLRSFIDVSDEATWLAASPSCATSADPSHSQLLSSGAFNAFFLDFSKVPSCEGLPSSERPDVRSYQAWEDLLSASGSSNAGTKLFLGRSDGATIAEDEAGLVSEIMSNDKFTHFGGIAVWEASGDTERMQKPQLQMELQKRSNLAPIIAARRPDHPPAYVMGSKRTPTYMPVNTAALFARQAEEPCGAGGEPSSTVSGTASTSDSTADPSGSATSEPTGTTTATGTSDPAGTNTSTPTDTSGPTGTSDPPGTDTSRPNSTGTLDPTDSGPPGHTKTGETSGTVEPTGTDKPSGTDGPTGTHDSTATPSCGEYDGIDCSIAEPTDIAGPTGSDEPTRTGKPTETDGRTGTGKPTRIAEPTHTDDPGETTRPGSISKPMTETKTYTITSCPPGKGSCEEGDVTSIITTYTSVCPVAEDPEATPGPGGKSPGEYLGGPGPDDGEPSQHGPGSADLTTPGTPRPTGSGGFETRPTPAGTSCVGAECPGSPGSTETSSPDAPAQAGAGRSDLGLVVALVAALAF